MNLSRVRCGKLRRCTTTLLRCAHRCDFYDNVFFMTGIDTTLAGIETIQFKIYHDFLAFKNSLDCYFLFWTTKKNENPNQIL